MKRLFNLTGGLLRLLLLLPLITACQPKEQDLAFETIAQSDIINYREEKPALLVIAKADEINPLVQNVLAEDPALTTQLRQLDYDRVFAILVFQGRKGSTGYIVTVRQITRQGNQVTVKAEFVEPSLGTFIKPAFTSPYHLVAVSKQGKWGQQIRFVLMTDTQIVAESSHFIP
jgi:hypothetical protein